MARTLEELIVGLGLDTSDYDKGIDKSTAKGESFVGKITGTFGRMAGVLGASKVFDAVGSTFDFIKGSAIGMNSQLETSTLQFQTLMGSADKATAHVKGLFTFAKNTPFETQPIIDASATMETFGGAALNTLDNLTLFGNASAATTKPLEDISFWSSRMYAALQAGKPIGEATANLMQLGVIGPDVVNQLEALAKGGADGNQIWAAYTGSLKKFDGAMALQANTWQGLKSSMSDTLAILGATALKPVFDTAKQGLSSLLGILSSDQVTQAATAFGESFANGLTGVIGFITSIVVPAFSSFYNSAYDTFTRLTAIWNDATEATSSIAEALGYFLDTVLLGLDDTSEIGFFQTLALSLTNTGGLIENLAIQVQSRFDTIMAVFNSVAGVVMSVFSIIAASFVDNGDLIDNLITAYEDAQQLITDVITAIGAIITAIFGQIQIFLNNHGAEISATLSKSWQQISDIVVTVIAILQATIIPILGKIANFIVAHSAEIQAVLSAAWTFISTTIGTVLGLIQGIVHTVLLAINGDWSGAWQALKKTSEDFVKGIYNVIVAGWELFLSLFGTSIAELHQKWVTGWNGLVEFVKGIPAQLANVGNAIVDMIWSGFESAWRGLMEKAKQKLQELRDMLPGSEPKDTSSPLYGLTRSGMALVQTIQNGIDLAGALQAPPLNMSAAQLMSNGAGNSILGNLRQNVGGITVNANIDARGADRGASDRIRQSIDDLGKALGEATDHRLRLGNL